MAARKKGVARKPKKKDALWRVAVQEAGHAVAAHVLGIRIRDMTIVPGTTCDGDGYAGLTTLIHGPDERRRSLDKYYDAESDTGDCEEKTFLFLIRNMQVSFAGMLAEELFFGTAAESGLGPDSDSIDLLAERLCPPDAQEFDERSAELHADRMSDEELSVAIADGLSVPKQEQDYLTDWVEHRTRKLIRTRRDLVGAVAMKLHERTSLKAAEVVKVILDAMRERCRNRISRRGS